MYGQVAQTRHLDAQVTALSAQNSALTQQISEREREIADAQTVAWLEQQARQLGYIFPGEQLYVIVPPGGAHGLDRRRVGADPDLQTADVADPQTDADREAHGVAEPQPQSWADAHAEAHAEADANSPLTPGRAEDARSRAVSSESGVEQWKLVGLITRRSSVRIRPPQPPHSRTHRRAFR